jgi:hypothetical protein
LKGQGKAVIKEGEHMRKVLRPESEKRNIGTDYIRLQRTLNVGIISAINEDEEGTYKRWLRKYGGRYNGLWGTCMIVGR